MKYKVNLKYYYAMAAIMLMGMIFSSAHAATATYTYDNLNRLTRVSYDNGTSIKYTYDAAGNITKVDKVDHSTTVDAPTVMTQAADNITSGTVTLHGSVNANNAEAVVIFQYGTTTSYGSSIDAEPGLVDGFSDTSVSAPLSDMVPSTTYHFRVVATNSEGTSYGAERNFTTLAINNEDAYVILTGDASYTVEQGSSITIYDSPEGNNIYLESGAAARLYSLQGSNTITIDAESKSFMVSRSGATVTLEGNEGTTLILPATSTPQSIVFSDGEKLLRINSDRVLLGDQLVTTAAALIDVGSEDIGECGAYIAPGVWKEFDCYNLAAIGKTTGDDPFTPSWRLIGGYWQWGRKGPSPAELTIRLNNIVQIEAGNNPVEGFSAITFSVGGTEVIVDITTIADDDTLDATTAYDEIVDAINAQLMAEGLDNVTATRGQIETVCFSTSIAGFTLGDCVGEYYTIIVTNTGPGQFVKGYFTEQQLDYETELNCSFITSSWYDTNTANFAHGPTGPDEADANDNSIDGWDESYAPDGAWLDSYKTSNDPCLPGFRVPTKSQWDGVNENNNQEIVGTWTGYNTNYNSGRFFGDYLMLPAAGFRGGDSLSERGDFALYWSSTEDADASYSAWGLYFGSSFNFTDSYLIRSTGFSVRCIAEDETQDDSVWYKDSDGDGYSDGENLISYTRPGDDYYLSTELIATVGDFDDNNYDVHPGADEICDNGIDDDCNGEIDEDCTAYSSECGAYIAPGVWKEFDCYNLAAIGKTTNDDPFTPSWRLIGGYWQWGRKGPDSSRWYNTNTSNFAHGPTGPDAADANDDSISGWDGSYAPDGAWSDSEKTSNDPCPLGYRVPTKTQWAGVIDNNTQRAVGTWSTSEGQYNSGLFFGDNLMLPAAGNRYFKSGSLDDINTWAIYWSSTEDAKNNYCSNSLDFYGSGAWTGSNELRFGVSVRCIAE